MHDQVPTIEVLRYALQVNFSKLPRPPFDPASITDLGELAEAVAQYADSPRNSPSHLYAAVTDPRLTWHRTQIPASQIILGPGSPGVHTELVVQAEAFIERFVTLAQPHRAHEDLRAHFRADPILFPVVPSVLVDYQKATPFLPAPKGDYGSVYRLLNGYHRSFAMILRGQREIPALLAVYDGGEPWPGNYTHLDRFESGRWIPRSDTVLTRSPR
jgi:hypothetical protein